MIIINAVEEKEVMTQQHYEGGPRRINPNHIEEIVSWEPTDDYKFDPATGDPLSGCTVRLSSGRTYRVRGETADELEARVKGGDNGPA